jgi:hypothetical protein
LLAPCWLCVVEIVRNRSPNLNVLVDKCVVFLEVFIGG